MNTEQHDTGLDVDALQKLGDSLLSVGDYEKAHQYYEKAAIFDADRAEPYVGIGTVALKQNRIEDAELAFRVACRLDPDCAKAYEGLGRTAQNNQQHHRAFDMFLKCLELDTDNLMALLGLFQASAQMGTYVKIIQYLEIYLNRHPDDASVMFTLATLYIKEDRLEQARTMLLKTLTLTPDNTDAVNLLEEVEQYLSR